MNVSARSLVCVFSLLAGTYLGPIECRAADASFSEQYTALTKRILLQGIELERFSLNYRKEAAKPPRFRTLRYLGAQEGAASCLLAFEIGAMKQFDNGRRDLLTLNKGRLANALDTALTGSIIGASSSTFELSSNVVRSFRNKHRGYDSRTANKFVASHLKEVDQLLAQRAALVDEYKSDPAYPRAVAEGKVLQQMRNSFVNEYSHFNIDTNRFLALQNSFFALNTAYNTLGAIGAGLGKRGLTQPEANGPSNILFIISGAIASSTPTLSYLTGKFAEYRSKRALARELGSAVNFEPDAFANACADLRNAGSSNSGSLIPTLPQTERFALYSESSTRFQKQLDNETSIVRRIDKIALGNSLAGPAIGGLLMTQGILGTYGYYHYGTSRIPRLKKEFDQLYKGTVVGTVGAGMNVVCNAAFLLGTLAYEHKLAKEKRLPAQLITERLGYLDEVEKTVKAM
ncbi:MAG: hypothetical protein K2Y39_26740 [Candidatus Obscuribacterales bacterium]|nr:hypothetical protein [Candidatus Obscuribacterales bacterium]